MSPYWSSQRLGRPSSSQHGELHSCGAHVDEEYPGGGVGLHLLITDPSTSPRTPVGKTIFGALYGVGVFGLYTILGVMGAPTFYDKLLCVPLLNLSVRAIDHLVRSRDWTEAWTAATEIAARPVWVTPRLNLMRMAAWIAFFGVMSMTGRTDGQHTGDALPFWEQACAEGRATACSRLIQLEASYFRFEHLAKVLLVQKRLHTNAK